MHQKFYHCGHELNAKGKYEHIWRPPGGWHTALVRIEGTCEVCNTYIYDLVEYDRV